MRFRLGELHRHDLLIFGGAIAVGVLAFGWDLWQGTVEPQLAYWLFDSGLLFVFLGIIG